MVEGRRQQRRRVDAARAGSAQTNIPPSGTVQRLPAGRAAASAGQQGVAASAGTPAGTDPRAASSRPVPGSARRRPGPGSRCAGRRPAWPPPGPGAATGRSGPSPAAARGPGSWRSCPVHDHVAACSVIVAIEGTGRRSSAAPRTGRPRSPGTRTRSATPTTPCAVRRGQGPAGRVVEGRHGVERLGPRSRGQLGQGLEVDRRPRRRARRPAGRRPARSTAARRDSSGSRPGPRRRDRPASSPAG